MRPDRLVDVGEHRRAATAVSRVARQRPPSERNVWLAKYAQRAPGSAPVASATKTSAPNRLACAASTLVVVARRVERDDRALRRAAAGATARAERGEAGVGDEEQRAGRRAGAASRRSVSRSRTAATEPAASDPTRVERGDGRRAAHAVGLEPGVRVGTARSAVSVSGPRMPSSRPASKPSAFSRRCSSVDVVAAQHRAARGRAAGRRAGSRSRSSAPHVSGPQMPSTRRPRSRLELAHARARSRRRTSPSGVTGEPRARRGAPGGRATASPRSPRAEHRCRVRLKR